MMRRGLGSASATLALALAQFAHAHPVTEPAPDRNPTSGAPEPPVIAGAPDSSDAALAALAEVIEIDDLAPAESASSVYLGPRDLAYRSRTQVSDVVRQIPGLMVSQHAGGGKSDQYFIRGFDSDHGTDIAIFSDGVPVNLPSHGHGQGYADTHFLIPETIESVHVHKGPYSARFGDFYTAGALELKTLDHVPGPTMWIAGGATLAGPHRLARFDRRLVGMASPQLRDDDADRSLLAVQIADNDGPFAAKQRFRQGNALVKWKGRVGRGDLSIDTQWYAASWNASGQIPASAVADGTIDRFGSLDSSEGGDTSRTSARIGYAVTDDNGGTWRAAAFLFDYRLRLFSNFTLFARDQIHGDQIEQNDSRLVWGLDAAYERRLPLAGMDSLFTVGAQMRNDYTETALWQTERRMRLAMCFDTGANPCNQTRNAIRNVAAYAEANIHVLPRVHVLPGIRFEHFTWDVDDLDPETQSDPATTTGGIAEKAIALPKLSVEIEATPHLNVFVNAGTGFHSNDARANIASRGAGALAKAFGGEAGFRTTVIPRVRIATDVWYLHLNSELVWSGDAGGTEASDPSRRYGFDVEASFTPTSWLRFDGSLTLARSTLVRNAGNSNGLALAPKLMGQGGVTLGGGTRFVSLRARGIGDRPGNDAGSLTAEGYLIFDLVAGIAVKKLTLNLTLNNLLNSDWREAQFADESRITPTGPLVEQMHFTPGIPLTATLTAAYTF